MTTTARTKENNCEFSFFKTPLRTPMRHGMLSSATMNDIASYSTHSNKHLKFIAATSMNDLQTCAESSTTPIRFNETKFNTPISVQRRRALGLVNHNSNQINRVSSIGDLSRVRVKSDEPMTKNICLSHPEDDLPHNHQIFEDTFDDLIPHDERIERLMINRPGGVNIFSYYGGMKNTIRCQSPVCHGFDVSTLLDMVDILN